MHVVRIIDVLPQHRHTHCERAHPHLGQRLMPAQGNAYSRGAGGRDDLRSIGDDGVGGHLLADFDLCILDQRCSALGIESVSELFRGYEIALLR